MTTSNAAVIRVTSENNELDSNVFMKLIREVLMLVSSATDIAEVRPLFNVQQINVCNSSWTREHKWWWNSWGALERILAQGIKRIMGPTETSSRAARTISGTFPARQRTKIDTDPSDSIDGLESGPADLMVSPQFLNCRTIFTRIPSTESSYVAR